MDEAQPTDPDAAFESIGRHPAFLRVQSIAGQHELKQRIPPLQPSTKVALGFFAGVAACIALMMIDRRLMPITVLFVIVFVRSLFVARKRYEDTIGGLTLTPFAARVERSDAQALTLECRSGVNPESCGELTVEERSGRSYIVLPPRPELSAGDPMLVVAHEGQLLKLQSLKDDSHATVG